MQLDQLLREMMEEGASDLHLKARRPPLMRVNGRLFPVKKHPVVTPDDLASLVETVLNPQQKQKLRETLSVDLGYGVRGLARFRGNIYLQRGSLAAAFRLIPYKILDLETLELPEVLLEFCDMPMGLVLVTGPTGSGKSTTLASLIKYVTNRSPVHIVTIEDPMEFLFSDGVASISQREVGTDTTSFGEALRNAMRQDPDVIMVGEMRDVETIETVITAAETGHLVFSTLHTNSTTQTVDRILDAFPANQQKQVRMQLSQVLKAVVTMKLVKRKNGEGRIAALEVLKASPKIAKLVEIGETNSIHEELESSVGHFRMQTMNQSLLALLVNEVITYDEAIKASPDPDDLSLKLRRMFPRIEESSSKGDDMPHSPADFSEILELQQFRKLYEEQEEKQKIRLQDKDEQIEDLKAVIGVRDHEVQERNENIKNLKDNVEKVQADYDRLKSEAQQKIDKLMERIKELNQRLVGDTDSRSGMFRK